MGISHFLFTAILQGLLEALLSHSFGRRGRWKGRDQVSCLKSQVWREAEPCFQPRKRDAKSQFIEQRLPSFRDHRKHRIIWGQCWKVKGGTWDFAFLMSSQVPSAKQLLLLLLPLVPLKRGSPHPWDSNYPGIGRGWEEDWIAPGDCYNQVNLQKTEF